MQDYLDPIDLKHPDFGSLYDELPLWSAPFGLMLLDRVPLRADLRILDAGAGTGFLTVELAQRCGQGASVIAVDPWEAAMARLQSKVDALELSNVELLVEDLADVTLPDASIDVVVSNLGINNFDDPGAVLETCHRLLVPGGALLLTTNLVGHMKELYEVYRRVLVESDLHECLDALDRHIEHRGTLASVTTLLENAGFDSVSSQSDDFRLRYATGTALLRHHFIRLGFLPAWKNLLDGASIEVVFDRLERELNRIAEEHGEISLTIPIALLEARKQAKPEPSPH